MSKTKIKLIVSNLLLGIAVLLLVGTTIAYFTDSKTINNTLTSGNVKIALTEGAFTQDTAGNLVEDPTKPRIFGTADSTIHDYGSVYPGQTVFKDPTVQNIGTNNAWMAVKVVLEDGSRDLTALLKDSRGNPDITALFSGALLEEPLSQGEWNSIQNALYNEKFALVQRAEATGITAYFFFQKPFSANESAVLFEQMTFSPQWDNAEMQELQDLSIHVKAFGVQTFGFTTCYSAMTQAFPDHFSF